MKTLLTVAALAASAGLVPTLQSVHPASRSAAASTRAGSSAAGQQGGAANSTDDASARPVISQENRGTTTGFLGADDTSVHGEQIAANCSSAGAGVPVLSDLPLIGALFRQQAGQAVAPASALNQTSNVPMRTQTISVVREDGTIEHYMVVLPEGFEVVCTNAAGASGMTAPSSGAWSTSDGCSSPGPAGFGEGGSDYSMSGSFGTTSAAGFGGVGQGQATSSCSPSTDPAAPYGTTDAAFGGDVSAPATAVGDYDGDGQLDLFVVNGGGDMGGIAVWSADGSQATLLPPSPVAGAAQAGGGGGRSTQRMRPGSGGTSAQIAPRTGSRGPMAGGGLPSPGGAGPTPAPRSHQLPSATSSAPAYPEGMPGPSGPHSGNTAEGGWAAPAYPGQPQQPGYGVNAAHDAELVVVLRELRDEIRALREDLKRLHGRSLNP